MLFDLRISTQNSSLLKISDFIIEEGKINFLFGESGIGKTLISKAVFGLLDHSELEIEINSENYEKYLKSQSCINIRKDGFFVFQEPSTHLNPLMTLNEQLLEGDMSGDEYLAGILQALTRDKDSYKSFIELLEIFPKAYRPSGGEKQRILLAMALKKLYNIQIHQTETLPLFIFDEPTGSLDDSIRNKFLDIIMDCLRKHKFTALIITHDYSIISYMLKSHGDQIANVFYFELVKSDNLLVQTKFIPSNYLDWLDNCSKKFGKLRNSNKKEQLLKIESEIKVHNLNLQIKSNKKSESKSAMILNKGEIYYLKAPSGEGKTTLIKIIAGIQKAEQFAMELGGFEFNEVTPQITWKSNIWGKKLSVVFQNADEVLNLNTKTKDIFKGVPSKLKIDSTNISETLCTFFPKPIENEFLNKKIKYLSGGQKQRLNILRALVLETDFLIMDEPLNGLDFISIDKVLNLLFSQIEAGKTILIVSHNEEIFDSLVSIENCYYLKKE